MRTILPLLALLPLLGCVDTSDCDGKVIEVTPNYTNNDGDVTVDPCVVDEGNGAYNYDACCPDGYDFLAVSGSNAVLCEQDCGLGSEASVTSIGNGVFVAHALADATLAAVEDLSSAP
jgi:hypothetical protein